MKINFDLGLTFAIISMCMLVIVIVMKMDAGRLEIDKVDIKSNVSKIGDGYNIVDITINDKTHQYLECVRYSMAGMCHYPECKYCKRSK